MLSDSQKENKVSDPTLLQCRFSVQIFKDSAFDIYAQSSIFGYVHGLLEKENENFFFQLLTVLSIYYHQQNCHFFLPLLVVFYCHTTRCIFYSVQSIFQEQHFLRFCKPATSTWIQCHCIYFLLANFLFRYCELTLLPGGYRDTH